VRPPLKIELALADGNEALLPPCRVFSPDLLPTGSFNSSYEPKRLFRFLWESLLKTRSTGPFGTPLCNTRCELLLPSGLNAVTKGLIPKSFVVTRLSRVRESKLSTPPVPFCDVRDCETGITLLPSAPSVRDHRLGYALAPLATRDLASRRPKLPFPIFRVPET
jgi:hypothetical protein